MAALSWRPMVLFWLHDGEHEGEGVTTLTWCQDVGSIQIHGWGLNVGAPQTSCASESAEGLLSLLNVQVPPRSS